MELLGNTFSRSSELILKLGFHNPAVGIVGVKQLSNLCLCFI